MTALSVNLNKVALLRNARDIGIPSVLEAAATCIAAGADGITVHPRPDERHIRRKDVFDLAAAIRVEFNIEGNPTPDFLDLVQAVHPAQCTLVPDSPEQRTSDHGWDLVRDGERLAPVIAGLRSTGIRVSLFLDPDTTQVQRAAHLGADRIELYTEPYARAFEAGDPGPVLERYIRAADYAIAAGMGVNAGHDLNLDNLPGFIRAMPPVLEVSIGHALIADALRMGLHAAVLAYCEVLAEAEAEAARGRSPGRHGTAP